MSTFTYDHIHLRSPDPEATARFYERMFGAELKRSTPDGKLRIDMTIGGAKVFVSQIAPDEKVHPAAQTPCAGLEHFGFAVKDLDIVAAEMKAKGAEFTMDPKSFRPGVRIAFLRAPEGVLIELLERTPV